MKPLIRNAFDRNGYSWSVKGPLYRSKYKWDQVYRSKLLLNPKQQPMK